MVTLQLRQLVVQPGQRIQLQDVNWAEFEAILAELGDRRSNRIAYFQDILEIYMPLPEHEVDSELIGDLVKIILEELDINNECFGSTTFKRKNMKAGVEPDQSFYIENYALMIGKRRIDLTIDPPPDLAIEIDVTSITSVEAYQALGVPELWRFEEGQLSISQLQNGVYQDSPTSAHFPQFDLAQLVEQMITQAQIEGRSRTLKAFRQRVREAIASA